MVAIAKTASGLAELDAASEATPCLVREILQEQRVHRALQAYVQVCDVAFCEGDDVHAGERQSLKEAGRVFLITAESIQRFGEDDVEPPIQSIAHQCLESNSQERRAGHGVVRELVRHRPPLARGMFAADPQLISDRGFALVV